ncbi:MAG: ADP-forming succinate--CoA ligase subunit beta [Deltaproteobacteria bacterium]|jgi:succinyl-CoA synthetase beta subunit|nr:ADP-forming succinate--CoA ligase subunit beta [Deltaproteobacteria bacterium]MBT4526860.1 ADP-forming succinate--CoA ligase subunit beta [Deltaproteobacteria bacterium]MBT7259914.1 ADP-forming succinate--CoA ligase subunit beta [Desulfobacula sp.]
MKIHEFQAKNIVSRYGVAVPKGLIAKTVAEALDAAKKLEKEVCVVKAQIHAGGRGKGGGVKVSKGLEAVKTNASDILGMQLITKQTGPAGQKVKTLLIEEGMDIKSELYFSVLIDRATQQVVLLASTEGGMDIEEVAEKTPEKILKETINPTIGLRPYQAQRLAFGLKLEQYGPKMIRQAASFFMGLYTAFIQEDCSLLEINPVVITGDDRILALDCKMGFDSNALFRHADTLKLRDLDEEDPAEVEASKHDLNFIKLDGSIGCMVNGAGLAMATMDIIQHYGSFPANFLDVGGTADTKRVEEAFKLITKDENVKCIFVNIFGGIVQCDIIAQGVVTAYKQVDVQVPVVIRLQGTNADKAEDIIANSGLGERVIMVKAFADAAQKAVEISKS